MEFHYNTVFSVPSIRRYLKKKMNVKTGTKPQGTNLTGQRYLKKNKSHLYTSTSNFVSFALPGQPCQTLPPCLMQKVFLQKKWH